MYAPMIKHPKFCGEREWRLLYPFNDEAIPRMRYLQRSSMMTKHVPLRLMMQDSRPKLPLKGVVVGEGDTYEEALADVKSAIRFHAETFGP